MVTKARGIRQSFFDSVYSPIALDTGLFIAFSVLKFQDSLTSLSTSCSAVLPSEGKNGTTGRYACTFTYRSQAGPSIATGTFAIRIFGKQCIMGSR